MGTARSSSSQLDRWLARLLVWFELLTFLTAQPALEPRFCPVFPNSTENKIIYAKRRHVGSKLSARCGYPVKETIPVFVIVNSNIGNLLYAIEGLSSAVLYNHPVYLVVPANVHKFGGVIGSLIKQRLVNKITYNVDDPKDTTVKG